MCCFDVNHEGSDPEAMARVTVRVSVRYTGRIGLLFHLGLDSDVRETVRLNDSVIVTQG